MMVYYVNEAAGFFTLNSLDHTLGAPSTRTLTLTNSTVSTYCALRQRWIP